MNLSEYVTLDATGLAGLVAQGETSPRELLDLAKAAIDQVNPRLNAVAQRMFEHADRALIEGLPAGPFHGVPFVAKDLDGPMTGVPYRMGSRALGDYVPDHDAEVIARLKRSGLNCLAKTTCPELGLLATNEPVLYGPARNPWDPGYTPGGSSGGSAALVAARAVPIGHGGDGGGSLRIPASCCGLVGLKATRGRIPLGPDTGEGWGGYVQPGVLTRSVRDTARALDALAGPDAGAPYWPSRRYGPTPRRSTTIQAGCTSLSAAVPCSVDARIRSAWRPSRTPPGSARTWGTRSARIGRRSTATPWCGPI